MRHEFKKLFSGRKTAVTLALLLVIGAFFCLFAEQNDETLTAEKYFSDLARVIKTAEFNLSDLPAGSYLARYQEKVIEKYSAIEAVPETVLGFGSFLAMRTRGLFALILSALIGTMLALTESDSRMADMLAISRRGTEVWRKKAFLLCIAASALTAISFAAELAVILARFGARGLFAPAVSLKSFELCPYELNIFTLLLADCLLHMLFSCICALIGALAGRLSASYLLALAVSGSPIAVYFLGGLELSSLFARYRSVNFFGAPISLLNCVVFCMTIVLCALFCALAFVPNTASGSNAFVRAEQKLISALRSVEIPHRSRRSSLFVYELRKLPAAALAIVFVLFGIKVYFTVNSNTYDPYDESYRALCREFSGELTDEKDALISEKLEKARELISMREAMRDKMMLGEITSEEYTAYIADAAAAEAEEVIYSRLSAQAGRIRALRAEGREAQIIYDSGWRALFALDIDLYLIFALIFLFGGIFAVEGRCRMTPTLRTSAAGLGKLSAVKFAVAMVLTAALFLVFTAVDVARVLAEHALETPHYSVLVLRDGADISLISYALLAFAAKLIGYLALSAGVWTVGRMVAGR